MKHQIFISYRRDGGAAMAHLIYTELSDLGYSVFYDIEDLKSGLFNEQLYAKIEECEDFVLVLPKDALINCRYDEDWVRKELRHAIQLKKNIIPVFMQDFTFPQQLPEDIEIIRFIQAVDFTKMNFFDTRLDSLVQRLKSKSIMPVKNGEHSASNSKNLIRSVYSIGSCDFENKFPTDGHFGEIIDRDKYNLVYFMVCTAPIKNRSQICSFFTIYDSEGNIVHEEAADLDWEDTYDRISHHWVIKGLDGSFVKPGIYKAVFRIDDSATYEYKFKITATVTEELREEKPESKTEEETTFYKTDYSSSPKALRNYIITFILGYLAISFLQNRLYLPSIICFAIALIFGIKLVKYAKAHICKSTFLSLAFTIFLFWPFGIYLLITSIIAFVRKASGKKTKQ